MCKNVKKKLLNINILWSSDRTGNYDHWTEHFHRHHSYRIRSIRIDHVNRSRYGVALSTRIIR